MKVNIGKPDRILRFIGGAVLLSLLFVMESQWRYLGLIGLVPIATSIVGVCPLYSLLGIDTLGKRGANTGTGRNEA